MKKRNPKFFEDLKKYYETTLSSKMQTLNSTKATPFNVSDNIKKPDREKYDLLGERYSYAIKMADKNREIDPNVKDIGKEVIYMYMSHFIDIPTGILSHVDPAISEDEYFSFYITNDDRAAYELYFKKQGDKRNISDLARGVSNLKDISSTKDVYKDLKGIGDKITTVFSQSADKYEKVKEILEGYETADKAHDLMESYKKIGDNVKKVISQEYESHNPETVIRTLKEDFKLEDYDELYKDFIIDSTVSFVISVASGGVLTLPNIGGLLIKQTAYAFSDIYDTANWLSLVQYTRMRVANRMMRAWGM